MMERMLAIIFAAFLALSLPAVCGCGKKSETATEEKETEQVTEKETEKEEAEEILAVGETASVEGGKVSVSRVTVTDDLASPEANALLLAGEAGEGTNPSQAPSAGDEFLMITFVYENTGTSVSPGVKPAEIKLAKAKGEEYDLAVTSGFGGLYNANPIEPGMEASVTAVFEVPEGEKGLILTYQPFGAEAIQFKIR